MKKIVFMLISVLAFVSCSTHDIETNQAEYMTNKYNAAFVKTFGQPAENQDWGFGSRVLPASFGVVTRGAYPNGNEWASDGYTVPADITDVSCQHGEVAASVFDRYRVETYKEAGYKPYIIAAMMLTTRFPNVPEMLAAQIEKARKRIKF